MNLQTNKQKVFIFFCNYAEKSKKKSRMKKARVKREKTKRTARKQRTVQPEKVSRVQARRKVTAKKKRTSKKQKKVSLSSFFSFERTEILMRLIYSIPYLLGK